LLQPISCFFLGNRRGPGASTEILLRATKEVTGKKQNSKCTNKEKKRREGREGSGNKKKETKKSKQLHNLL